MEESSECERCRTWEEDLYWKHFSSMHFFLFLPQDFHHHLVLPTKFAENMMAKLPKKVSLIGPSATVWDVELNKTSNVEFCGDGWKEFVKAYDLKEHNLLLFKYRMNSSFDVLVLDQESFCEKEASYFVKQCRHVSVNERKRRVTDGFRMETIEDEGTDDDDDDAAAADDDDDDNHDDPEFVVLKKSKNDNAQGSGIRKSPQTPKKVVYTSTPRGRGKPKMVGVPCTQTPRGRVKPMNAIPCESQSKSMAQSEKNPDKNGAVRDTVEDDPQENGALVENGPPINGVEREPEENGASEEQTRVLEKEQNTLDNGGEVVQTPHSHVSTEKKTTSKKQVSSRKRVYRRDSAETYSKEYKSNRRPVTAAEIENAKIRGLERVTENSFLAVMKPNNVYKRFYLHFPVSWMNTHLLHRNREAVLRVGEKKWLVFFYHAGDRGGGFTKGWKKFALDNLLEESDACLFKLASHKDDPDVVFDVEIFRVVPEPVPPSPSPSPASPSTAT